MDTNASVNLVLMEFIVKTVLFFFYFSFIINFILLWNIQDDSCWNNPCEGCQQTKANNTEYICTCSKYTSVKCKSEIKRKT